MPVPTLPITLANVREWFPHPRSENPLVGEPWWQLQGLGLIAALQLLRLIPECEYQQQALIELRRAIDTGLLAVPTPDDEEIRRFAARSLAPYCPSPDVVVEAMLDLAELKQGERLLDLGSGDGRIVFAAVRRKAWGTGIEIDGKFVAACDAQVDDYAADFIQGDVLSIDWGTPDVVTCYLVRASMNALHEKFRALPSGTRIISHAFTIEGWTPTKTIIVAGNPIYLWVV